MIDSGDFIGTGAIIVNDHLQYELGYRVLERAWGNGYGGEICEGLTNYWLQHLGGTVLYAYADEKNIPSIKILNNSRMSLKEKIPNHKFNCLEYVYILRR